MERGDPVKYGRLWATGLLVGCMLGSWASAEDDGERQLVIVTQRESAIQPLTPGEVRQAFLGIPVFQDQRRVAPVLNTSSKLLYEVFLQKAIYLSADNYERQIVRRVFQYGGARPPAIQDQAELVALLAQDGQRVAFMWHADARRYPKLRVVQVLWRGEHR